MIKGFHAGEWFDDNGPLDFESGGMDIYGGPEAAYWDGSRWWWCPIEVMLDDTCQPIRDACIELIIQGVEPTDDLLSDAFDVVRRSGGSIR